jgi:hypothetical protein
MVLYGFGDGNIPLPSGIFSGNGMEIRDDGLGDPSHPAKDGPVKRGLDIEFPEIAGLFAVQLNSVNDDPVNKELFPAEVYLKAMRLTLSELSPEILAGILERRPLTNVRDLVNRWVNGRISAMDLQSDRRGISAAKLAELKAQWETEGLAFADELDYSTPRTIKAGLEADMNKGLDQERHKAVYLDDLARRLLKDALMAGNKTLKALGQAVDQGITVTIKTLAARSDSDTGAYALGVLAHLVGVDSTEAKAVRIAFSRKDLAASPVGGIDMNQIDLVVQGGSLKDLIMSDNAEDLQFVGFSPLISGFESVSATTLLLELAP